MRLSIVALLCLLIVVVHSATTTRRTVGTSKAPARKSAYTYLRSVRGKQSCASGTCPFWEHHGRSFAALRCYRREYQDCACLHRMCFSSCMFTEEICNNEMVSCLQQICPRCMPASASAMCSIYDSMAERVAVALSAFACYSCCPVLVGSSSNSSAPANGMTTTIMNLPGNSMTTPPGSNVVSGPMNAMTTRAPSNVVVNSPPVGNNNGPAPGVGSNGNINVGSLNTPVLAPNNNVGNNPNNMGVNGGIIAGNAGVLANNNNVLPNRNQRVKQTARTTKRIITTRRTPTTTRRTASAASTVRANKVKNAARTSVQTSKKPQGNRS